MDEEILLSKFDQLIQAGIVLYDKDQEIISEEDQGLKVSLSEVCMESNLLTLLQFHFILTSALLKKPTLLSSQLREHHAQNHEQKREGSDINTRDFEIGEIGDNHFLAANMFCFARPHLMLLTSNARLKQYEALQRSDFEAAWMILDSVNSDYVTFYNCGQNAGCSRLHKHMQLMLLPKNTFAAFLDSDNGKEPHMPFYWFHRRLQTQHVDPDRLSNIYQELLVESSKVSAGGFEHASERLPDAVCPHNMVLIKRWMMVIPRRRAGINKQAGANAIGMLGHIAIATHKEIDGWKRLGLTSVLAELGVPKPLNHCL